MVAAHDTRPTLVFLHLPKTGGSTVRVHLEARFSPEERHLPATPAREYRAELAAMPEARRAALRCVGGHLFFGIHELLPRPCRYATLVRDPVDRVASLYFYARTRPDIPLHARASTQDLATFARDEGHAVDNVQTRFLSGVGFAPEPGACTTAMLEQALRNLDDHFEVVGTTPRLEESVLLLGRRLGWSEGPPLVAQNVNAARPARALLDPEALRLIEARNALDRELFSYARDRLAADLARTPPREAPAGRLARLATAVRARFS